MLYSPTQSTEVLCAGMEIQVNPVMLVSRWKLLPGLNDDLQGLPKEWLLWEVLKRWREQQRLAAEWLCELGFQHKTYTGVVTDVTKHGGGGGREGRMRLKSEKYWHGMLLQCFQPLLDYMGHMGFKSWCYIHQEYLYYNGDPKPFTKTINHYTLFLNCGKGWGREIVVVVVVVVN